MSAEDRRRQLIEIAIDLFSRKGFAGTTTKEIASAAGVTEAIVFRHFATKRDFYTAILDKINSTHNVEIWLRDSQQLMDACDDEGLIRLIVSRIIDAIRTEPRFERLMILAAMEGHELAELHMQQFAVPIAEKMVSYIEKRQAAGAIAAGNPHAILLCIAGAAQFYAMHKFIYAMEKDAGCSDASDIADQMTAFLTRGLLINKGQNS